MQPKLTYTFVFLLLFSFASFAQNLTIGIESGINFSNINKTLNYDRYVAQPGPVNGIFAQYELGNWFVLQSGINHATFYFSETGRNQYYPANLHLYSASSYYDPFALSSSLYYPPYYGSNQSKYSFLRIPLLVKFKTPGKINFEIGGGAYYAFLTNDEYRGKDKDFYSKEYRDENFPPMNDWGWILASSINYNINNKWNVFASGQITTGKEVYFENNEGKIGSTELTIGVGYRPFLGGKYPHTTDTLGRKIRVIPHAGINISNTKSSKNSSEYKSSVGFSSGISLSFMFDKNVSLVSGAWYERKGYGLNYSGNNTVIYQPSSNHPATSTLQSEIQLDYLIFPFMFDLSFGKRIKSNIYFGTYFSLLQNAFSIGEKIETNNYDQGFRVTQNYFNESLDHAYKKSDAGFIFGYRMDVPIRTWADIFISVHQSWGAKNILNGENESNPNTLYSASERMYNNSLSILFGFNIPLQKNNLK